MEYIDDGTQKEKHREYSTTWTNGNIGNGSYSNDFNICRQNLMNSCKETGGPFVEVEDLVFGHLYLIGLFGIGPKNFPSKVEYTLNANGTVATESSHSFIYK